MIFSGKRLAITFLVDSSDIFLFEKESYLYITFIKKKLFCFFVYYFRFESLQIYKQFVNSTVLCTGVIDM